MTSISFLVIIASFVALLVVGTEDMGSGHMVFANRAFSGHGTFTNKGINVQTETNQDQGCEGVGGTSGITNACTATSGRGPSQTSTETSTETQVTMSFGVCNHDNAIDLSCNKSIPPLNCNNLGCNSISCTGPANFPPFGCTTNNGVLLTSCTIPLNENLVTCTLTETHPVTHTVP